MERIIETSCPVSFQETILIGHALDGDSGKRAKKIDYQRSESRLVEVLEQVYTRFNYLNEREVK